MRLLASVLLVGLLLLPGCPKKAKPDEEPTATGLKVKVVEEEGWVAVARPVEDDASVEAGLGMALREAVELKLAPDGNPLVVYEGEGHRVIAFPVAGPARLERPWFMRNVEGGQYASAEVEGGLMAAAARNEDFLYEIRARGLMIIGPVYHRILDDPRVTAPEEMRVQLLAPISPVPPDEE
ncbi:MAG: GyrI-like domain-containing protein [Deltaproteobacteria bacterium]|nr:GyrI-like domain-containing protein [Deltaproteobacteria bacterium]